MNWKRKDSVVDVGGIKKSMRLLDRVSVTIDWQLHFNLNVNLLFVSVNTHWLGDLLTTTNIHQIINLMELYSSINKINVELKSSTKTIIKTKLINMLRNKNRTKMNTKDPYHKYLIVLKDKK